MKRVTSFAIDVTCLVIIFAVLAAFFTYDAQAQTQIAYCKTSKGEIITIAAGSPCLNGSWPL